MHKTKDERLTRIHLKMHFAINEYGKTRNEFWLKRFYRIFRFIVEKQI